MSSDKKRQFGDVSVPTFIYGTAWKEDRTAGLVEMALDAGFTGIDTANQRKHYFEAGVGETLKKAFSAGTKRENLFLQTKFTYQHGQDHRLPYDPQAPFAQQVDQSMARSLEHLGVDYVDSYVLHGPSSGGSLTDMDWETWGAMEAQQRAGKTRLLGVSNVRIHQLQQLWERAEIKPSMVQNRCYAIMGWDRDVRQFCAEKNIGYQGFSLLTANRDVMSHPNLADLAQKLGYTPAQVVFRFSLQLGMLPLTGTSSREHMAEDLAVYELALEDSDVAMIEGILTP